MGEEDCPNGAVDFLVIGGGVVLAAALIVIVVSYVAGGCHDNDIIVTQIKISYLLYHTVFTFTFQRSSQITIFSFPHSVYRRISLLLLSLLTFTFHVHPLSLFVCPFLRSLSLLTFTFKFSCSLLTLTFTFHKVET